MIEQMKSLPVTSLGGCKNEHFVAIAFSVDDTGHVTLIVHST